MKREFHLIGARYTYTSREHCSTTFNRFLLEALSCDGSSLRKVSYWLYFCPYFQCHHCHTPVVCTPRCKQIVTYLAFDGPWNCFLPAWIYGITAGSLAFSDVEQLRYRPPRAKNPLYKRKSRCW